MCSFGLALAAGSLGAQAPAAAVPPRSVLDKYCLTCHNARLKTAGLVLDLADIDRAGDSPETWEKVARKLRTREMPPPGAPAGRRHLPAASLSSLETALDAAAEAAPHPGRVPVHRLNRTEYANAIRDLLALDVDGRSLLADEPDPHGFDNVASVLTVSPALLESYLSAASTVSRLAVGDPAINPVVDTFKVPTAMVQDDRASERQPFGSRGGTAIRYHFPLDGEYTIKVVLKRQLYLYLIGMGEPHQIDVRLDGVLLKRFTVGGEGKGLTAPESFAGNTQGDPDWEVYMHTADAGLEVRVPVKAGTREVGVSFVREHWEPEGVLQPPQRGFARTTNELYFGEPAWTRVLVGGPYEAVRAARHAEPAEDLRLPAGAATRASEEACATRILSTLARRAYRRPVTDAEVETLLDFYKAGRADGGFDVGIQRGLRRILSAPAFLFRVEREPLALGRPGTPYRLDATSTSRHGCRSSSGAASRTTSCSTLAVSGTLTEPAVLERQVRRMLRDPRSQALVDNFANQWLKLGKPRGRRARRGRVSGLRREPARGAAAGDAPVRRQPAARGSQRRRTSSAPNYTFVNERLARHYEIPNVYGSHFRRVIVRRRRPRRAARPGQHPDGHVVSEPDVARAARTLAAREPARRAAAGAAARCAGAQGERRGRRAPLGARAPRGAPQEPELRGLSRADGSARLLARELRRARQVADDERRRADRRVRVAARRQPFRGRGRAAGAAVEPPRGFRPHVHRAAAGLLRSAAASEPPTGRRSARSSATRRRTTIAGRPSSWPSSGARRSR